MPRAASASGVFNAIADTHRRDLLVYLAPRERPVSDMVTALRLRQPSVSKHLGVLRKAGLVHVRQHGRQRLYRTNAQGILPVHDWTKSFESFWSHQLLRVKERAEARSSDSGGKK